MKARAKMKTKWEEMRLMRPHAYMQRESKAFRPLQDECEFAEFPGSQMRSSAQGPITSCSMTHQL